MKVDNKCGNGKETFLKPSMEVFVEALDNLWDMVIIGDTEGNLKYVNDAVSDVLGYGPDEYLFSHRVEGLAHPDDRPLIENKFKKLISKRHTGNF